MPAQTVEVSRLARRMRTLDGPTAAPGCSSLVPSPVKESIDAVEVSVAPLPVGNPGAQVIGSAPTVRAPGIVCSWSRACPAPAP